jgi:putative hydrolase of the HAD superfamily
MLRVLLFDLDDTLYARASGLWPAIGQRINAYMVERMGLQPDAARALRQVYLDAYGTTLNGLRHEHGIDPLDYLAFVHDLPLERYLEPSPELQQMLGRLPQRKIIFTNADAPHAQRVITRLGVAQFFERIIDVHALNFVNKPDPRAYQQVLELVGAMPDECLFVDDAVRNLLPAHALGMTAVLVSPAGTVLPADVDYQIDSILELEPLLRRLEAGLSVSASRGAPGMP